MKAETTLCKGQILDSGFEILDIVDLEELDACGIWARHRASGAEVFHILNDDKENLFGFTFATAPEDSTGVAHILEHSVLCGSKHYPLKDAFLVLAQGSLQTYLNAWTYPDKTVYPASSVNEHDYFNLMGVYGDAVFRPLISEWTFMQEGHRLVFLAEEKGRQKPAKKLSITGVVYNEMKGAYSSLEQYAGHWSASALLPETPYAFESGGDPGAIPDLSWEGLKKFHSTRYVPANCRVFLAGNIPTEKQLDFLGSRFFSDLPPGRKSPTIARAAPWDKPRRFTIPCPAGGDSKPTGLVSWLCGDSVNPMETMSLAVLSEILLGHDGSPLARALIESGLGEDISPVTGLEGSLRETVFSAGLRGMKQDALKIEKFVLDFFAKLVKEGIPKEEIEAALLSLEFSHKEIKRSGGPYSLVWLRRSLCGWLHGAKPWETLVFTPNFEALKEKIAGNGRFFEELIQKYFLDNPHRAFIEIKPEKDFLKKKEAALAKKLAEKEAALSGAEKDAIMQKQAELEKIQKMPDSPQALASIPHLSRKDLSPEIEKIPREFSGAGGLPSLTHPLFTNGISYIDLAFPVDVLESADYPWLPFFSRAVVSMGLPGKDYGEVSSMLAQVSGGFHAVLNAPSAAPGGVEPVLPGGTPDILGRDCIIYKLKALDEKVDPSLDLVLSLITQADFSDLARLRDLAAEFKNDIDGSIAPSGHHYAGSRSCRDFSRACRIDDLWNGLDQVFFVHRMVKMDTEEIKKRLESIRDKLISAGVLANIAGNEDAIKACLKSLGARFGKFGAPTSRPRDAYTAGFFDGIEEIRPLRGHEVFFSPSLQVGFAAITLPSAPFDTPEQAADRVLAHQLSTGALWEQIRMKGGAYGAFAYSSVLDGAFCLSTYRDPNPLRSLEAFSSILNGLSKQPLSAGGLEGDALDKAVIGAYANETQPQPPAAKSAIDFLRFRRGIEDSYRSRFLSSLIAVSGREISAVLNRLAASLNEGAGAALSHPVIIAGPEEAKKAAQALGVEAVKLPV
ncbi:MAG: insulinase family protein [Treponema sp.]|jgi:Zn-dependent M16 (insulinase) family peptidase|nr:insulinase family protein [Treponema sp.]